MKIIIMILLMANISFAESEFDKHPIYKQIVTNNPNIDRSYAMKLSNIIHRKSIEYDIEANLITAILMQESGYDYKAERCVSGMRELTLGETLQHNESCNDMYSEEADELVSCLKDRPMLIESEICTDFGIGQIHYSNFFAFSFNVTKLTTDLEYSVDAAFVILKNFKNRYFDDEMYWWERYNSSTPSKRKLYRERVQRWM